MTRRIGCLGLLLAALAAAPVANGERGPDDQFFTLVSWNISGDAFVSEPEAFSKILAWSYPDIVVLDEVSPYADIEKLKEALQSIDPDSTTFWNISAGESGGRQLGVIASQSAIEAVPELAGVVPYPADEMEHLSAMMPKKDRTNRDWTMEYGIPVHGAIVSINDRRLLVVTADLQCCGDGPDSWQEARRRVEATVLRARISEALKNHSPDGIVFAGDFNMVNSTYPMSILLGPYPQPHGGLIPAEVRHANRQDTWTWDGRGTPFPSNTLDYQFHGPQALEQRYGLILDTETTPEAIRANLGLALNLSARTGRHRPIAVIYRWR